MRQHIFQEKTRILAKQNLSQDFFSLKLSSLKIAANARPGQFVEVRVQDTVVPLLRRPLGIHRVGRENFELLFQIIGKGTQILSQKRVGEYLDVIGPLGHGFDFALSTEKGARNILIAGGMGVAPLLFLAQRMKGRSIIALIGAKNKAQILCENDFKKIGCEVMVATDDGSKGFRGKVTDLLKKILHATRYSVHGTVYSCGPRPMLKEISRISQEYKISAQISLEEHMACGIGACLGCVVDTKDGFKRVCKEGPVFRADEIIWGTRL